MSRIRKVLLLALWLIVATHVYAFVWSHNLDAFPQLPEEVGRWIARLTGTDDSEDIERLTTYYILLVSLAVVSIATGAAAAALWAFRFARRRPA